MKKFLTTLLSLSLLSTPVLAEELKKESLEDYNNRMEWFVEAQYGLFMHFGLYSMLGGEWKDAKMGADGVQGYSEWIQGILAIPKEEYSPIIKNFNPQGFDAEKIVTSAKAAGMKYVVITTKHHEGFCLWDSKYTEYDLGSTLIKDRDLLKELKDACDKHGLKLGLYYSILDWHHPSKARNKNTLITKETKSLSLSSDMTLRSSGSMGIGWIGGAWKKA